MLLFHFLYIVSCESINNDTKNLSNSILESPQKYSTIEKDNNILNKKINDISGICGDNLTFIIDSNNLIISGVGDMFNYATKVAELPPWNNESSIIYNATVLYGVTSIGDYAFYNLINLISISIPESVVSIGVYSMYHTFITSITLPESIEWIDEGAFGDCEKIVSLTIPEKVKSIERDAFYGCFELQFFDIKGNITSIGPRAFDSCTKLHSITLPESLITIQTLAFNSAGLTSIIIPKNVRTIGRQAFTFCEKLTDVTYLGDSNPTHEDEIFTNTNVSIIYVKKKYSDDNFCSYPISYLATEIFTMSEIFTQSEAFTNLFSQSIEFTQSFSFSVSNSFSSNYKSFSFIQTKKGYEVSFSISFIVTYIKKRSVSMSISFTESNVQIMSYFYEIGANSLIQTYSAYYQYFPYIIYYLSPSYSVSYVQMLHKKKMISQEQLIGISCGSAAAFFLILGIIILSIRRKYEFKNYIYDFSISEEEEIEDGKLNIPSK